MITVKTPSELPRHELADDIDHVAALIRQRKFKSAAWRLADIGLQVREILERHGIVEGEGLDTPTNMGATLPKR